MLPANLNIGLPVPRDLGRAVDLLLDLDYEPDAVTAAMTHYRSHRSMERCSWMDPEHRALVEAVLPGGEARRAERPPAPPRVVPRGDTEAHRQANECPIDGLQPHPLRTIVKRFRAEDGGLVTAITRIWTCHDARSCRLCPVSECQARYNVVEGHQDGNDDGPMFCVVVADGIIPEERCALYAAHGER